MRVHLKALGCRLNEAELESWADGFQRQGHKVTRNLENADVVVINTCAVTQEAVRKSRQLLRRAHRRNPLAKLVVSGCYSSLTPKLADEIEGIDLIVPNQDKEQLVEITTRELELSSMPVQATIPGEPALFNRGRDRAFIKVQDGCRYRCTFCIVTVARGEERSRSIKDIVQEINTLHSQGVQEAVLTGVHVGGYGSDLDCSLYELIHTILADTDIPRLRLASIEPWDLSDNFFDLFQNKRLMPHMHLPLQSGSDSVLKRMARRCKTADFKKLVDYARTVVPNFNVTTDIIVGFPGESEQEWQQSLAFIEEVGFSHIHIFTYSKRAGTKAASLPDQISQAEKKLRSRQLHAMAARLKNNYLEKNIGLSIPVLWESDSTENESGSINYFGYAPNFVRTQTTVQKGTTLANKIYNAEIISVNNDNGTVLTNLI